MGRTGGGVGTNQYQVRGIGVVRSRPPLSYDYDNLYGSAADSSTTPEILARLARLADQSIRATVARNLSTPPRALALLARAPEMAVRAAVARNPSTPPTAVAMLAREHQLYAPISINPVTPSAVLARLATHTDQPELLNNIAKHHHTSTRTLTRLARHSDEQVRARVARNPSTPPAALNRLVVDEIAWIRSIALSHPNTPEHIRTIVTLSRDTDRRP